MTLTRKIAFTPAYDYRGQTPDYGQHPMHISFVLKGEAGALVCAINTAWYIDRNQRPAHPYLWGIHFHAHPTDPHVDESELHNECDWLDGATCHSRQVRSSLDTEYFDTLIREGEEALWTKLEALYAEVTNGAKS